MQTEIWKIAPGFAGYYEVSNHGQIRSVKGMTKKIMKTYLDRDGYVLIRLSNGYSRINVKMHRLVAQAFLSNPSNCEFVRHRDGDRANNKVENLEWITAKQQVSTTYKTTSIGRCKPIIGTNVLDNSTLEFPSIKKAAEYGFNRRNIFRCLHGLNKTNYGYTWKFKN